jgi:hypothetical protein
VYVYNTAGGFSSKKLKAFYLSKTEKPWREQYAYSLGKGAMPYFFPYFYMAQVRWKWTNEKPVGSVNAPYALINHFWHAPRLADDTYKDGGTPNNDTVYSAAWINIEKEPIILSHPDMGDRYFSFHFTQMKSDNLDVVSSRATGSKAGNFALVHKSFKGTLPEGVVKLKTAQNAWFLLLGRTAVLGKDDMPNVATLQKQLRLTPLSYWGKSEAELPASRDVWKPASAKDDPLAHWKTINRVMTSNPPPAFEKGLENLLATINVGPGQNVEALDEDSKRGLARAMEDGLKMMLMARNDIPGGDFVNGWRRNPPYTGRMGDEDVGIYVARGVVQSFKGLSTPFPEEARYFTRVWDAEGNYLNASKASYRFTFAPGELPPADAFWSLTMYGLDANLVSNPIDRFSIGDRTPGMKKNADGSLTLYIQHESPGEEWKDNWLPAPDGRFTMTLRLYHPRQEVYDGEWVAPPLETVK